MVQAAKTLELGYVADVSARECWQMLQQNPDAILIDVRTQPEWVFSGLPNLSKLNKKIETISWKLYPTMEINSEFTQMVQSVAPNTNTPLFFLCKTGGRSADAAIAMTQAGYPFCYNVAGGFEGDRDSLGHRGKINGWKAAELPWEQA